MATVVADMSMSLDGFVADANDGINEVFAWFVGGEVTVPTANPQMALRPGELVPVLFGDGVQLFDKLANAPVHLETPRVTETEGVTHLYFAVR